MTNPYEVLGVTSSATDEEIKEAYRNLAKKYHPDQYSESPLNELADEKMKQINEAYDQITTERKAGAQGGYGNTAGGYGGNAGAYGGTYGSYNNVGANGEFNDVRRMINEGRIADAEQILNGVPGNRRTAEWYYLKGSILYRRGWLEEAKNHFANAVHLDPNNAEYNAAFRQVNNQSNGAYGGYNPNMNTGARGCNSCDCCTSLICADCCCECMGGDLIRCC